MSSSSDQRDGGASYSLPAKPSLPPLSPSSLLYTHCQSVTERHFHLHHQLLGSSSPLSDIAAPSLALDLSRLDVELQAIILSLSQYTTATSSPTISSAQDQQSLQVVADMQRVSQWGGTAE